MDFDAVIEGRRSIRSFKSVEVEGEKIKEILETVKYIPSAHNLQDYEIYTIKSEKMKRSLVYCALGQDFIEQAPIVFVVCADTKKEGTKRAEFYSIQAATMAAYVICLKSFELGLGSCWIGAFQENDVRDVLHLPNKLFPVAIIPVGYTKENPTMPKRRSDYSHAVD